MPIYTDTPSSFNNVIINRNGNTVTVKTGGLDFCWIAVTSGDMGKKYFMVKCEAKDSSVFENVPDDYTVCITLSNHIPYVYKSMPIDFPTELTYSKPTDTCSINNLPSGATVTYSSSNPNLVSCVALSDSISARITYITSYIGSPSAHMDTIIATIKIGDSTYTKSKAINIIGSNINTSINHQNIIWNGNKVLKSSYTVYSGYTLTIDGALLCDSCAKITVQQGANLVLKNNAKIKLSHRMMNWKGIEVNHSSDFTSMGYVEKYPGAELELQSGPVTNTIRYSNGTTIDSRQVCLNNVISTDITWENPMIILSPGVKIAPGGSLKIKNTVKVKENARIDISGNTAISSGGRLVISNSKIMSLSSGLWGGIFANEAGAGIQLSNAIIEKANYGLSVTQKADSMKIDRSSFLQCDTALMLSNSTCYSIINVSIR